MPAVGRLWPSDDDDDAIGQIQSLTVGAVVLKMVRGSWEVVG